MQEYWRNRNRLDDNIEKARACYTKIKKFQEYERNKYKNLSEEAKKAKKI